MSQYCSILFAAYIILTEDRCTVCMTACLQLPICLGPTDDEKDVMPKFGGWDTKTKYTSPEITSPCTMLEMVALRLWRLTQWPMCYITLKYLQRHCNIHTVKRIRLQGTYMLLENSDLFTRVLCIWNEWDQRSKKTEGRTDRQTVLCSSRL